MCMKRQIQSKIYGIFTARVTSDPTGKVKYQLMINLRAENIPLYSRANGSQLISVLRYLSLLMYFSLCDCESYTTSLVMFPFLKQRNCVLFQNSPQLKRSIIISNIFFSLTQVEMLFSVRFFSFNWHLVIFSD